MRETVERPAAVVDINALPYRDIEVGPSKLRVGALVRMSELAAHPGVRRQFPVITQALELSASAQIRNMASIGGNIMQRPRCLYFRDVSAACNRRTPGSGCAAIGGRNRTHAVLGTSDACVATHPSDLAVALVALDATVITRDDHGEKPIPIAEFFRQPGSTPEQEHNMAAGALITAIEVPVGRRGTPIRISQGARSGVLRVRDRLRRRRARHHRGDGRRRPGGRRWCRHGAVAAARRRSRRSPGIAPRPSCGTPRHRTQRTAPNRCRRTGSRWS